MSGQITKNIKSAFGCFRRREPEATTIAITVASAGESPAASRKPAGLWEDLWKQLPAMIATLGLPAYIVGRFAVDGFYGQLHTTAEAAGIGYASILEPAAIVTAIGTLLCIILIWSANAIPDNHWIIRGAAIAIAVVAALLDSFNSGGASIVLLAVTLVPAAQVLFGTKHNAGTDQFPERIASIARNIPVWLNFVITPLPLILFVGSLFGAHYYGKYEGNHAAAGNPVTLRYLGLTIPSMLATVVHVQPIPSGPAVKELNSQYCWLEIGTGAGPAGVLLYDPATKVILTISPDQIVMTSANPSCLKPPATAKAQ
jgi:hypothetical protein